MTDVKNFLDEAKELLPAAVALRRRIHAKPELGLDLPLTTEAVLDGLQGLDVEIARGKSTSGLVVSLTGTKPGSQSGRTILLRGDMDALPMPEETGLDFASEIPGRMHACGHDSHTAMLVQAVHLLHRHRDELPGTVKFMFQPGEEGHAGARLMIEDGLLDADPKPDAAFALHISPNFKAGAIAGRPGPLLASADTWTIKVKGQRRPRLDAASGGRSDPGRLRDRPGAAGDGHPPHRCLRPGRADPRQDRRRHRQQHHPRDGRDARHLADDLRGGARDRASGHPPGGDQHRRGAFLRGRGQIRRGFPVTVNDAGFVDFARGVATDLVGADNYIPMPAPFMGAEDFSYVLQRMPGCMMFLGVMPEGTATTIMSPPCHSNHMILNEDAMAVGIAMHAAVAHRFLTEPLPG